MKRFTSLIISVLFLLMFTQFCSKQSKKDIAKGVKVTVQKVSSWTAYQNVRPKKKEGESYNYWKSNDIRIEATYLGTSKILNGSRTVTVGQDSYEFEVKNYSDYEDVIAPKADGRFCEILVYIENAGNEEHSIQFISKEKPLFDARLITSEETTLEVSAFRIPGMENIASISLITSWKGPLGIQLPPGKKTWVILVFDVPINTKTGNLQLKEAATISVSFPEIE